MIEAFRKQKKALLSMEYERGRKESGYFKTPKRPKTKGMDAIGSDTG